MSQSDESDNEVKEIKIDDVKEEIIKQQEEEKILKKKRDRKKNKKKKAKLGLLAKYQDELNQQIDETLIQNENLLVAQKKEKNQHLNTKKKKKNLFKKGSTLIQIENDKENEDYDVVDEEIKNFKESHFSRSSLNRQTNFSNKI